MTAKTLARTMHRSGKSVRTAYKYPSWRNGGILTRFDQWVMNMRKRFPLLLCVFILLALLTLNGQAPVNPARPELAAVLNFEIDQTGTTPQGWGGGPPGTTFVDRNTVHSGMRSARLERNTSSPEMFSTITKAIPIDFAGK